MTERESERQYDEQTGEVTDDDLEAENAAELPDREAMSVVAPTSALGLRPGSMFWPGPVPMDTTQPMEP
jgi:hypothetical protein